MDKYENEDLTQIDEHTWQEMSASTYSNKSLAKTFALAKTIERIAPDIIALSEVGGRESFENFNRYFLGEAYDVYMIEGNSNRGIDLGYLVKRTLPFHFKIKSHKKHPLMFLYPDEKVKLTAKTSHKFSRDVLELRMYDENHKHWFIFLIVHLKSKLDPDRRDPEGRKRRAAELRNLIDIYLDLEKKYPQTPIILTGDFNGKATAEFEPEFADLYERSDLADFGQILGMSEDSLTSYLFFTDNEVYKQQLDYFFISQKYSSLLVKDECRFAPFSDYEGKVLPKAANLQEKLDAPSDHYGIEIGFDLSTHPLV
jgi:endonuclease/exonuclease/phosphatase family metal-dependent hydrolase